jgi:2-methylcitrate dehydratase PrpD
MHGRTVDYTLERTIATHLATTSWDDLTVASREAAGRAILWYLATGLEGVVEPGQKPVLDYIRSHTARPEATVLGVGLKTSAELAALFNGRAGKAWEHEDKYWVDETIGFATGCIVVPAALAMAEAKEGVSGKELVAAVALAIDLEARLLHPVGDGFLFGETAANSTFALGNYGAAAAAAKIIGLDTNGFMDALGLVHSQAAGNYQGQAEGRGVALQGGFSVRNGVTAARLAQLGMKGPWASISGLMGLYAVHYPKSTINYAQIVEGLGKTFLNERLGFKGYPCGVVAHPAIDAALEARKQIAGREVTSIEVLGPPSLAIMANPIEVKRAPKSSIESQFSIPWAIACALKDGHFSVDHCAEASLSRPELRAMASLVLINMSASYVGSRLAITLSDGEVIEPPLVMASKGHPNNPLSTEEIAEVLRRAARRLTIPDDTTERVITMVTDISQVDNVGRIVDLLSPVEH